MMVVLAQTLKQYIKPGKALRYAFHFIPPKPSFFLSWFSPCILIPHQNSGGIADGHTKGIDS
jgi:hypothetical protein